MELARELLQLYASLGEESREIPRVQRELEGVFRRKDKLLDLNIDGRVSDEEFAQRNRRLNEEAGRLRLRLEELEAEKKRTILQSSDGLRQTIERELEFRDGFSAGVIDALLDRVELYPQREGEPIRLSVYIKDEPEEMWFAIHRERGKPSVCSRQYT